MKQKLLLISLIIVTIVPAQILSPIFFGKGNKCCTFYVSQSTGNDANPGTIAQPWKTISKVNGTTLIAGQSVGFKRGDTWRETLTPGQSGTAGVPITFAAYGTGNNPKLSGGAVIDTSGYVLASTPSVDIYSPSASGSQTTTGGTRNTRTVLATGELLSGCSTCSIQISASSTQDLNITGSGFGPGATAPSTTGMTRITWSSGSSGTTVTHGTTSTSDCVVLNISAANVNTFSVYTTARNYAYQSAIHTSEALWDNSVASDQSQTATVSGYVNETSAGFIHKITQCAVTSSFTYTGAQATNPVGIWENGTVLAHKTSISAVDSSAGSWWWDGSANLYIHASDNSNVSSNGKVYEGWNSSITENIVDNGKSYLVFDGVDSIETCGDATGSPAFCGFGDTGNSTTLGGIKLTGSHNVVRNLASHDHNRHALAFYTGATNNLATNVTLYNTYSTNTVTHYGTGTANNELAHCTVHTVSVVNGDLLINHGTSTGWTIDYCTLYFDAGGTPSAILEAYDSGSGSVTFHDNTVSGASFTSVLKAGMGTATWNFYRNTIDCTQSTAPLFSLVTSTGLTASSNSSYCPSVAQYAVSLTSTSTGATLKDNIFQNGLYELVDASSETSFVSDYNLFFGASGTPFTWGVTAYSFANWKTNSSQDSNSLNSNPLMVNPSAGDFTLQGGSPAIGAGIFIPGVSTSNPPNIGAK